LKEAAANSKVMDYVEEPLVSIDFKGNPASSSVDGQFCQALGGNMVKVVTWYDNEWGYSCRTADLADLMASKL
jgi:glyceraldehyde 3-phosphate dehydrogenase